MKNIEWKFVSFYLIQKYKQIMNTVPIKSPHVFFSTQNKNSICMDKKKLDFVSKWIRYQIIFVYIYDM